MQLVWAGANILKYIGKNEVESLEKFAFREIPEQANPISNT